MTDNPSIKVFDSNTLSADQLELLNFLLEEENSNLSAPAIVPRGQRIRAQLSFAQERLWILDQIEPGNTAYNMPGVFRLIGCLDVHALERSLHEIVCRHESLRTTFSFDEGQPIQVIASNAPAKIRIIDLARMPEAERNSRAHTLTAEEKKKPFNLQEGPLFRFTLIHIRADEHILLLALHHIVSDGWSMGILYRELSALYEAFSNGKGSPLSDLPIQYADYADWQRERLKGEVLEAQMSYWRRQLSGAPPALELAPDYTRPPIQVFRGASEKLELSNELHLKLKSLSHESDATLYMTLLAAFKIQLHRYTGQDDIVVGSPIAGRNRIETEGLIGFFLNNLVLRTDLSDRPSFRDVVRRVREVALGAYSNQDIPFEKLLREMHPERDLSRTPFFQVYFNMLSQDDSKPTFGNLTTERFGQVEPESKFDLTLYIKDQRNGLFVNLVYNASLYKQRRMAEMLRQFEQLLWHVVDHPDDRIDSYSLVTSHARKVLPDPTKSLSDDWQGAIHDRCALHAKITPQQLAVIDCWGSWSYAQLNSCSNQLAHYLLDQGIKPEEIIAIYGHRSATLVCAVLGVLKAGGAFLILDPAYPATRHIDCLQQAQPRAWLELEAAGTIPSELAAYIDTLPLRCRSSLSKSVASVSNAFSVYSDDDPQISTSAESLAYVSFTSGSTGRPKGVLGRHGPLSHFLPWQQRTFELSAADRYTMLSGLSHDPLQRDMFTPLWFGASLFIPDSDIIGTANLAVWMKEQKITFTHLVPSMLELLLEPAAADCELPSLRYAYFVGEKLTPHHVARLRQLAPNVNCIAAYGTTETQRAVSYFFISNDTTVDVDEGKSVYPLGRGIDDVQLLVLSAEQRLAGVGEIGEIYLRSPHLARGYLGDEDLTQSRFLKNPFSDIADDRLYRTGDLGRYLSDGNVEFAGRADRQIKIRGFRIEPQEIEAALAQHPSINEVVVTARKGSFTGGNDTRSPDTQLVAYVVFTQKGAQSIKQLRNYLRQKLPEYMVPWSIVILDYLPLTPNGKVDRKALSALQSPTPGDNIPRMPRTVVETVLLEIWGEILKVERIGIDDNFFDLGGHSLLGTRLIDKVCQEFQIKMPLRFLFECPTVASMAIRIGEIKSDVALNRRVASGQSFLFELKAGKGHQSVFFLPGGFGGDFEFLVYARLVHYAGNDYRFYGLRARSADGLEQAHNRVEKMAADYLKEIRQLQPDGPYFLIGNCIGGIVAYEIARQLEAAGQRVALLVLMDTLHPSFVRYLRYRANRVKRRVRHYWGARCFRLRDNYYLARTRHHFLRMRQSPWNEQLGYLISKTRVAIDESPNLLSSLVTNQFDAGSDHVREGYVDTLRRYRPRPYQGRVVMLNNETVGRNDPTLGWKNFVRGGIDVHTIPGNHEAYIRQYVRIAGEKLRECLDNASSENSSSRSPTGHKADVEFDSKSAARLDT